MSRAAMDDIGLRMQLIDCFNRQAGSPRVLSLVSAPQETSIGLGVPADLDWFRGHFPGKPVLPGIVQVHWAVLACRALYGLPGGPREIKRLKFKRMVAPPAEIELALARVGEHAAQFRFSTRGEQTSGGTIVFGENA